MSEKPAVTFKWMLDTNMLSELVHAPAALVAGRVRDHENAALCTSIITAADMRFGVETLGATRFTRQVDNVLGAIAMLPFEPPAHETYKRIRAHLAHKGTPIRPNDLFIASHAPALNLVLVTHDAAFHRVPGLLTEDWLT